MSTSSGRRTVDVIDRRVGLLFGAFLLLLLVAVGRAAYLGMFRAGALQAAAQQQQVQTLTIPAVRGTITDRNGVVLALSESADTVIADPYVIRDPQRIAARIAPLLGISELQAVAALTKTGTGYSPLAYDVPAASATKIADMRLNGIWMNAVEQRVYPRDTGAAQVLGWVGSSNDGLGGLEYYYNHSLAGVSGVRRIVNDARGQPIQVDTQRQMKTGGTLRLAISAPLQAEVEQVLAGVGAQYHPVGATAIAMNPDSGQILAVGNWPFVNANNVGASPLSATEDQAVGVSYEPGSTFKAITVAGALQDRLVTPDTVITVPSYLDEYGHIIHDAESHPTEDMTVAHILQVSSNIGAVEIGKKLSAENKFAYWVSRFGFGRPTGVDLPGEQRGVVPTDAQYSGLSIYNLPFGQGLEVTPIQLATAYSAIANGGILRSPRIVESIGGKPVKEPAGHRIISPGVAAELRDMLRGVFADGGTASGAWIPHYDLAGKTGTANIVVNGKYSNTEYMASFVGMVPASNPKLLVAVIVDQPKNEIYGGSVAAPAFQKIVGWAVPYLGINPCPSPCPASALSQTAPTTS